MTPPRIAASIADLVADATVRTPVRSTDAKSGASFERVEIDGEPLLPQGAVARAGLDHARHRQHDELGVPGVAGRPLRPRPSGHRPRRRVDGARGRPPRHPDERPHRRPRARRRRRPAGRPARPLRRPPGDVPRHLLRLARRPSACRTSPAASSSSPRRSSPRAGALRRRGADRRCRRGMAPPARAQPRPRPPRAAACTTTPESLAASLAGTPHTFVAGDWKLGNLGSRPDGRTVLLDWAYPGAAPPCWELAWYLALNRARLPRTKEATIAAYREALERRGIDTTEWWDRQLGLCLVGIMATFAWEKAVGGDDELALVGTRRHRGISVAVTIGRRAVRLRRGGGTLGRRRRPRLRAAGSPPRRPQPDPPRRRSVCSMPAPARERSAPSSTITAPASSLPTSSRRCSITSGRPGHQRSPPTSAWLPFGDDVFDAVVASFVVNHVADPAVALREMARVTRVRRRRPGIDVRRGARCGETGRRRRRRARTDGGRRPGTARSTFGKRRSARPTDSSMSPRVRGCRPRASRDRRSTSASTNPN